MFTPPIKGRFLKKPTPKVEPLNLSANMDGIIGLYSELKSLKKEVISTVDDEVQKVEDKLSEVDQKIVEMMEIKEGPPGQDADEQKIADYVLSQIRQPKDGRDGVDATIPDIDELAELAALKVKPSPASLKIIKESVEIKDEEIVPKLNRASNLDDLMLSITNIKDWDEKWGDIKAEISRNKGGMHGGGDTVAAGSNITITNGTGADAGKKVISSTGGSGTTFYTETPSGTIDGVNVTYTVAHTITSIMSFAINGQYIHPFTSNPQAGANYTFTGTTITFTTALDSSYSGTPFTVVYC